MKNNNVIAVLKQRGLIEALTSEEILSMAEKPMTVYCGFDPTSDSLHLGNMVAIMGLAWFQKMGHSVIPLLGGATGMIGDPSGKSKERQLLDEATLIKNGAGIKKNLEQILDFHDKKAPALLLNNLDWLKEFSMIQFLRDVGKFFRLGPMLGKESVRQRMESEEGLSYTEFSYQLLQAYDFLHLFDHHGVQVQIGGSDQWGNITAGIDFIRRLRGRQVYGLTFPLLTTSEGKKFGKSEEGAIWLAPHKLSPYQFYQQIVRVADADVIRMLRMLTFLEMEEIEELEAALSRPGYAVNTAQRRLAEEVTRIVHGEDGLQAALKATEIAKPGAETVLDAASLEAISSDVPTVLLPYAEVVHSKLIDLLVKAQLQPSKGQAKKLILNGGVYLNNKQVVDEGCEVLPSDLVDGRLLLLAIGKKNKILIRLSC